MAKTFLFLALKLLAWIALIFPGSVILHESGHALLARCYGIDSKIDYLVGSSAGICYYSSHVPDSVGFFGGMFAGLILIIFYFIFRRWLPSMLNLALICLGASHIYYSILEGFNFDYGLYYPIFTLLLVSLVTITSLMTSKTLCKGLIQ